MDTGYARSLKARDDKPRTLTLPQRIGRLNRSKKLDGKPGQYNGRPIVSSSRLFRQAERVV